jgi:hypothetical protein
MESLRVFSKLLHVGVVAAGWECLENPSSEMVKKRL